MAIFNHCNKEECPAAALPTTAARLSRCHHHCHKASALLPLPPPRCRHLCRHALANATVAALTPPLRFRCRSRLHFYRRPSRRRQCRVAAATLSPPPPPAAAALLLPPFLPRCCYRAATNGCRKAAAPRCCHRRLCFYCCRCRHRPAIALPTLGYWRGAFQRVGREGERTA